MQSLNLFNSVKSSIFFKGNFACIDLILTTIALDTPLLFKRRRPKNEVATFDVFRTPKLRII